MVLHCNFSRKSAKTSESKLGRYSMLSHNIIQAAYLQKAGWNVCVLERRHLIGGAAVTEEIIPGFKFSRASYVLSLLRPQIYKDLELKKYGLKVYLRDPKVYTPLLEPGGSDGKAKSLLLGRDSTQNAREIAKFSCRDAERFKQYEAELERIVAAIDPLLDSAPLHLPHLWSSSFSDKLKFLSAVKTLINSIRQMGTDFPAFYKLMTAPAAKILDKWFESEPLKATLAIDSVTGANVSPKTPGSGYVLLHHVMGELEGMRGAWGYVEGGMGTVSQSIANCALDHGAEIFTEKPVSSIITNNGKAEGVVLKDGTEIRAKAVLSNATPKTTFLDLLPNGSLPQSLLDELKLFDFTSPVTKINVAVNKLPNFLADPNSGDNTVMPHHRSTIHINCEQMELIHEAYLEAQIGRFSSRYVLLHNVMGELEGVKGAWGYVEGGMGTVSQSIANCALDHGAEIFTEKPVSSIITKNGKAEGVVLKNGIEIRAKAVLSNATPMTTFLELLPNGSLPQSLLDELRLFDFTSPVTKINVAVNKIPNFLADPNSGDNTVMPHHHSTIYINCEQMELMHEAYLEAQMGRFSSRPLMEMVIPSSLDQTLAPPGCHVVLLFTQYTPYKLAGGKEWDDQTRNQYADLVFNCIEQYAPGFKTSVIGRNILTPPDLEKIFGLTGGNIFHGAMSLDQLYFSRPLTVLSNYRSPIRGLYLCGSGAHPGGGVMGAAGRLASQAVLEDSNLLAK